jgi:hypothetical protein
LLRKITILLSALSMMMVMAVPPVMAHHDVDHFAGGGQDGQKDPQPTSPPGRESSNAEPSENANDSVGTGRGNRHEHGNNPNDGCNVC